MTELSPRARALFAAAREDYAPSPERLTRVGAIVAAQVGATMTATSTASAGAATAGKVSAASFLGGLSVAKIIGAVALVALSVGGAAGVATIARPTASPPPPVAVETALAPVNTTKSSGPTPSAVTPSSDRTLLAVPPPATDPAPAAEGERSPSGPEPRAVHRGEKPSAHPPAPRSLAPERIVLEETEEPASTREAAPEEQKSEPDVLAREVELLQSARRALTSGDPARALTLTSAYSARYPRGTLRQEVLVVRALSLCNSSRIAEGRRLVTAIETASPRSPHLERLRQACGSDAKR